MITFVAMAQGGGVLGTQIYRGGGQSDSSGSNAYSK